MKKNKRRFVFFIWMTLFTVGFLMPELRVSATATENPGVNITSTTLMYALDKVNVRANPGTDAEILGELQQGETIFAMELTEEGWYRVAYGDEKGYIRQDFLAVYGMEGEWQVPALEDLEQSFEESEEEIIAESAEQEESAETLEEEPDASGKEKKNLAPVIIMIVVLVVIIVYSGVQILQDRKRSEEEEAEESRNAGDSFEEEDSEQDISAGEDFEADIPEEDDYEKEVPEEEDFSLKVIMDCDTKNCNPGNSETEEEIDIMELAWEMEEKDESE